MGKKEDWKEAIINALFPPRCILCDELTESGKEEICPACKAYEIIMEEPVCKKCGRGILLDTEEYCGNCKRHGFSFSTGMMLYELTEEVEDALVLLKYKGRRDKGIFFGKKAGEVFGEKIKELGIQAIIPVPVHPNRRRERGYNQAEVIGESLAKVCGIPLVSEYRQRVKKTKALKDCSPEERLLNLLEAIHCEALPFDLKRVLLVDDIFTTGATMEACSRKLLEAGAEEVHILSIAGRVER